MFLVAYFERPSGVSGEMPGEAISELFSPHASPIPILGIPACGMYAKTTVFDLVLPRVLAGEKIGRQELAELGHGGFCIKCEVCNYPCCPFGKY